MPSSSIAFPRLEVCVWLSLSGTCGALNSRRLYLHVVSLTTLFSLPRPLALPLLHPLVFPKIQRRLRGPFRSSPVRSLALQAYGSMEAEPGSMEVKPVSEVVVPFLRILARSRC